MILDCWRFNIKFGTPRSVLLLTGERMSNIDIEEKWDRHDGGSSWTGVRGQELRIGDGNCRRVRLLSPVQTLEWNH